MPRPMSTYRVDYAALTADQIRSHIAAMRAAGKNPPRGAAAALAAAREREGADLPDPVHGGDVFARIEASAEGKDP